MTKLLTRVFESHRFRGALNAVAHQVIPDDAFEDPNYSPAAIAKLRELDREAVKLALAANAYDILRTAEAIVEMFDRGEISEALSEKRALLGRDAGDWAWKLVGQGWRSHDLLQLTAPFDIGLDLKFRLWLCSEDASLDELKPWLEEYGPKIERFVERVRKQCARS